jgi:hypothetical protein
MCADDCIIFDMCADDCIILTCVQMTILLLTCVQKNVLHLTFLQMTALFLTCVQMTVLFFMAEGHPCKVTTDFTLTLKHHQLAVLGHDLCMVRKFGFSHMWCS